MISPKPFRSQKPIQQSVLVRMLVDQPECEIAPGMCQRGIAPMAAIHHGVARIKSAHSLAPDVCLEQYLGRESNQALIIWTADLDYPALGGQIRVKAASPQVRVVLLH